jgi:hypothetical protein
MRRAATGCDEITSTAWKTVGAFVVGAAATEAAFGAERTPSLLPSQIEGTQSSHSDLLLLEREEAPGVPTDDVVEASSSVAGLEHGLTRHAEGVLLSSRLLWEILARLLSHGQQRDRGAGASAASRSRLSRKPLGSRPTNAWFR